VAEPAAPSGAITSQSAQSTSPSGTAAAAISGLSATGSGAGALTVASYGANPTSGNVAVTNGTGVYYDVAIGAAISEPTATRSTISTDPRGSPFPCRASTREPVVRRPPSTPAPPRPWPP
jgi:hypothetical protein